MGNFAPLALDQLEKERLPLIQVSKPKILEFQRLLEEVPQQNRSQMLVPLQASVNQTPSPQNQNALLDYSLRLYDNQLRPIFESQPTAHTDVVSPSDQWTLGDSSLQTYKQSARHDRAAVSMKSSKFNHFLFL